MKVRHTWEPTIRRLPSSAPADPGLSRFDAAWRLVTTSAPIHLAILTVFAATWLGRAVLTYYDPELGGLFRWIGVDFGFYLAQARVFAEGAIAGLYSLDVLNEHQQALTAYTNTPGVPLPPGPVPYPPVFAWLVSSLAGLSPPVAFAIFTLVNAAVAGALAWRVASLFPPERRLLAATLVLASTAFVSSLWFGQAQTLLSLAFGEAFIALRRGRDGLAGAWLSVMLLKPQYLLLIVPVLAWKRRWRSLVALAAGGLVMLAASLVVAGPSSIGAYFGSLVESASAAGGDVLAVVAPDVMVNWRALVLRAPLPGIAQLVITLALSGLTAAAVLIAFRGPWQTTSRRFDAQMTMLAIGTILASYHSHIQGAPLLAVPLAAYLAGGRPGLPRRRRLDGVERLILVAGIVAPWAWFVVRGGSHANANTMVAIALVLGFGALAARLLPGPSRTSDDGEQPAHAPPPLPA